MLYIVHCGIIEQGVLLYIVVLLNKECCYAKGYYCTHRGYCYTMGKGGIWGYYYT